MEQGATVIGEGGYGCVHKPSLKCKSSSKASYKNKVSKSCYNHLILNMANIAYDMEKKDHYLYDSDKTVVAVQKGETLIKTVKIYENMLQTVKNGELYITSINNKYKYLPIRSK